MIGDGPSTQDLYNMPNAHVQHDQHHHSDHERPHHQHHHHNHHKRHGEMMKADSMDEQNAGGMAGHHQLYFDTTSTTFFLFENWSLQTVEGLLAALVVTALMSMTLEALSYSIKLQEKFVGRQSGFSARMLIFRLCRSLAHLLQSALAYTLMLGVMTYNIWVLVVLMLGAGFGYFIARPFLHYTYDRWLTAKEQERLEKHKIKLSEEKEPLKAHPGKKHVDRNGNPNSLVTDKLLIETQIQDKEYQTQQMLYSEKTPPETIV